MSKMNWSRVRREDLLSGGRSYTDRLDEFERTLPSIRDVRSDIRKKRTNTAAGPAATAATLGLSVSELHDAQAAWATGIRFRPAIATKAAKRTSFLAALDVKLSDVNAAIAVLHGRPSPSKAVTAQARRLALTLLASEWNTASMAQQPASTTAKNTSRSDGPSPTAPTTIAVSRSAPHRFRARADVDVGRVEPSLTRIVDPEPPASRSRAFASVERGGTPQRRSPSVVCPDVGIRVPAGVTCDYCAHVHSAP